MACCRPTLDAGDQEEAGRLAAPADQARHRRTRRSRRRLSLVADYNSVDRYRRFAADLQKRGWSQARLEKLMGGNFLRVYRDAWGA